MANNPGNRKNGEITVFLSLTLTCICALLSALLASVRVAGSGWYLQLALDSSLDSLMSKYHRDVWEEYHLLMLEFEDEPGLANEMRPFLTSYLEADPSYRLEEAELFVGTPVRMTDRGGEYLEQEILDYMKFGIWDIATGFEVPEASVTGMEEAESIGQIAARYQTDSREILKLEETIEDIGACLQKQKEYLESGRKALRQCNGRRFIAQAEKVKKELKKIPDLVACYEKKADEVAEKIKQTEHFADGRREKVTTDTWSSLSGELAAGHAYTDREGERRRQVKQVEKQAEKNMIIIESAIEKAKSVQEYIDDWEPDDEGDELDEDELWEPVLQAAERFIEDSSFAVPEIRDKATMGVLEQISRMAGGDLLSVVVPGDAEISSASVSAGAFPSQSMKGGDSGTDKTLLLTDTLLINEYIIYHFRNFLSEKDREFRYEQEYILNGEATDRENLSGTVNRIIKLRGAMNLLYLLKDETRKGEADLLAAAITGAAGIAPLTRVVSFFILTVWAFGEAVLDVKTLLSGGKIPFFKQKGDFRLSLEQLLRVNFDAETGEGASQSGLDYQGYLRLFFIMQGRAEKNYRILDMVQKTIGVRQPGFLAKQCAFRVSASCSARGQHVKLRRDASRSY